MPIDAPPDRIHGFGIVGCGVIGPTHANAIADLPNARLVAVSDLVPERAEKLAGDYGAVAADLDDLLARDDIDVVTVCTPSGQHAEVGVAAAAAGKHVLVEKPIDVTMEAADRLVAAAGTAGVTLGVVSQHRFDPAVIQLRQLVDTGGLGRLILGGASIPWYRSQAYYDSGDWRGTWEMDGGGALINQGVHYLDLLRWMMGPVDEVTALCATQAHDIEVEDVALALLRFRSGALGVLKASTAVYPGLPARLEVCGTEGTVIVEDEEIVLRSLRSEQGDVGAYGATLPLASVGRSAPSAASVPQAISGQPHRAQFADFLGALDEGRRPAVAGEDGRASLALVRAVYDSARTGRPCRPVVV